MSFSRNRTDDLRIDSPALWPTELDLYRVKFNQDGGIFTVPGIPHKRAQGNVPTMPRVVWPLSFSFSFQGFGENFLNATDACSMIKFEQAKKVSFFELFLRNFRSRKSQISGNPFYCVHSKRSLGLWSGFINPLNIWMVLFEKRTRKSPRGWIKMPRIWRKNPLKSVLSISRDYWFHFEQVPEDSNSERVWRNRKTFSSRKFDPPNHFSWKDPRKTVTVWDCCPISCLGPRARQTCGHLENNQNIWGLALHPFFFNDACIDFFVSSQISNIEIILTCVNYEKNTLFENIPFPHSFWVATIPLIQS